VSAQPRRRTRLCRRAKVGHTLFGMPIDGNALLLSLAIGCVGLACFVYGKRQGRLPQMLAGATLTIYPYFVPNLVAMAAVALLVVALLWIAVRLGA
jgi:hypothetical protein